MTAKSSWIVLLSTLVACSESDPAPIEASADIAARSGSTVSGSATFIADAGEVTLQLVLSSAPPGAHGVHLHETGDCSATDGTSAGGHWNPDGHDHGEWGSTGHHLGDIGNVVVDAGGAATLTLRTDRWTIGDAAASDIVGKAVIVHANEDDYTPPVGNAGARIGCGVVALQ